MARSRCHSAYLSVPLQAYHLHSQIRPLGGLTGESERPLDHLTFRRLSPRRRPYSMPPALKGYSQGNLGVLFGVLKVLSRGTESVLLRLLLGYSRCSRGALKDTKGYSQGPQSRRPEGIPGTGAESVRNQSANQSSESGGRVLASVRPVGGTGVSGTGVSGTGLSGTGLSGTGLSGTGLSGTGVSGTGVSGPGCRS